MNALPIQPASAPFFSQAAFTAGGNGLAGAAGGSFGGSSGSGGGLFVFATGTSGWSSSAAGAGKWSSLATGATGTALVNIGQQPAEAREAKPRVSMRLIFGED